MKRAKIALIIAIIGSAVIISIIGIFIFFLPSPPLGGVLGKYALCVRGGLDYGENNFTDNGDGTITDSSTGLIWMKNDSGMTMNWSAALNYAEGIDFATFSDWRLPNAKELQSIVDYTHAPDATNPTMRGPALNTTIFNISEEESWFWTSTTHLEATGAVYICFGIASAYNTSTDDFSMNAHGAGAQRSDPKSGDPADYPVGKGPQGDEIRIYNYARAVRNAAENATNYVIVDTGQNSFYGEGSQVITPLQVTKHTMDRTLIIQGFSMHIKIMEMGRLLTVIQV